MTSPSTSHSPKSSSSKAVMPASIKGAAFAFGALGLSVFLCAGISSYMGKAKKAVLGDDSAKSNSNVTNVQKEAPPAVPRPSVAPPDANKELPPPFPTSNEMDVRTSLSDIEDTFKALFDAYDKDLKKQGLPPASQNDLQIRNRFFSRLNTAVDLIEKTRTYASAEKDKTKKDEMLGAVDRFSKRLLADFNEVERTFLMKQPVSVTVASSELNARLANYSYDSDLQNIIIYANSKSK